MTELRLVPTQDARRWDRAVRGVPHRTQFHSWAWLDLLEPLLHARLDRLVVVVDGRDAGVLPVVRDSGPTFVARGMPFPYFGPLVPEHLVEATVRAYRAWQLRHGVALAVFDLPPEVSDSATLSAAGAAVTPSSTIVVDLPADPAEVGRAYSSMRRRSLRRAERAGAAVRPTRPGELSTLLDGVLDQAYEAHGVPSPYPAGAGAVIEEWMRGRDDVFSLTAVVEEELAGIHLVLTGGPVAMSWLVACDRRFREIGPNALLYHEALVEATRRGFHQMDLVGRVDDGVARFKTSFGGREVPYLAADVFLGPAALRRSAKRVKAAVQGLGRAGAATPDAEPADRVVTV